MISGSDEVSDYGRLTRDFFDNRSSINFTEIEMQNQHANVEDVLTQ